MVLVIGMARVYPFQCTTVHRVPSSRGSRNTAIRELRHTSTVNTPYARERVEERKQRTRQDLLQAALRLLEDQSFSGLSLREVTREAGVVPTAFYRHFDNMEELGLALIDESFRTLREMIRAARADLSTFEQVIRNSVEILVRHVHENRLALHVHRPRALQRCGPHTPRDPYRDPAVRERPGHRPRPLPLHGRVEQRGPARDGRPDRERDGVDRRGAPGRARRTARPPNGRSGGSPRSSSGWWCWPHRRGQCTRERNEVTRSPEQRRQHAWSLS